MYPFHTDTVYKPWTTDDIKRYESEGTQRDKVIYNSASNSRITLTEHNIYLCNIKQTDNSYVNFYICVLKRNLFYFIVYIPQMERLNKPEFLEMEFTKKLISKLKVYPYFIESYNKEKFVLNDYITFADGSAIFVKVNANVDELLFPKLRTISNKEILCKLDIMQQLSTQAIKEDDFVIKAYSDYINNLELMDLKEKRDQIQKVLQINKYLKLATIAMDICVPGSGVVTRAIAKVNSIIGSSIKSDLDSQIKACIDARHK